MNLENGRQKLKLSALRNDDRFLALLLLPGGAPDFDVACKASSEKTQF